MDFDSGYIVYAQTDSKNNITAVNSSAFVGAGWGTPIDQGIGDRYHHAQGNYLHGGVYTAEGIPRYKMENGKPVERTAEEIEADRAALAPPAPTALEQLRADVDFLAIMQGVEL